MNTEKGLNFTAEMAAAIWRGEKWVTRRPLKWRGEKPDSALVEFKKLQPDGTYAPHIWDDKEAGYLEIKPRFKPGDVLAIREPWRTHKNYDEFSPRQLENLEVFDWHDHLTFESEGVLRSNWGRLRAAMHMPFGFARMRRVVVSVRAEKLGAITDADVFAEGASLPWGVSVKDCYAKLWEKIYGPGAWKRDRDQLVWRIEFDRRAGA